MWACAFGALLLFLALSIAFSFTRGPWWDEGLFADVAINFRDSGHLRSSVLAPFSFDNLPGVDRYMYWQLPAYLVSLGLWFRAAPVTIQSMRIFSVLWGCVFGGAWFVFVRAISRNEKLALLIASAVIVDFSCVSAASNGRMDMMCAALGQAALALWVALREARPRWAALSAGAAGALALFSHPMGVIPNACLAILLLGDRRKLRGMNSAILAVPYLLCAALWLRYIGQDPQLFFAQARNVSAYRIGGLSFLLSNIANDFQARYLQFYFAPHSGLHKAKIFSLLFGVAGVIAISLHRKTRSLPLTKLLLVFAVLAFFGVAVLDDLKYPHYFIYVTPILTACGALWLFDASQERRSSRWIASGLAVAFVVSTVAAFLYFIRRNEFVYQYEPVVAKVRSTLNPDEIVMGPSELGFALGFHRPLIDDCTLGFTSGIVPEVFVMYPACRIPGYSSFIWDWSSKQVAARYHLVLENSAYSVYVRNRELGTR